MTYSPNKVLSGYKEIANFLGVSTRTVFRHIDSIPVSRQFGNKVMILECDLTSWIRSRVKKDNKSREKQILKK